MICFELAFLLRFIFKISILHNSYLLAFFLSRDYYLTIFFNSHFLTISDLKRPFLKLSHLSPKLRALRSSCIPLPRLSMASNLSGPASLDAIRIQSFEPVVQVCDPLYFALFVWLFGLFVRSFFSIWMDVVDFNGILVLGD
jgi:hypothetical protein